MRKLLLIILGLIGFSLASFAQSSCIDSNHQCVTDCCSSCGGTTWVDKSGEMFCQGQNGVATQQCIDACLQCGHDFQQCTSGSGSSGSPSTSGSSMPYTSPSSSSGCCGSAAILGSVLGLASLKRH